MKFGQKAGDAPSQQTGSGEYLRSFRSGETKVRFLEEPDEWTMYQEHFTPDNKSFPCTGDAQACPGCTHENDRVQRRSRKYGTYLFLVKNNQTLPFKIPVSLANRLQSRSERNGGTLLNRDYVVIKSGTGLDTDYDVDQEEKYPVDIKELMGKLQTGDVESILEAQFREHWGDPADYEPKVSTAKASTRTASKDDEKPTEDEKPPFEQPAAKPDEEVDITEEELKAMTRGELVKLWDRAKFKGFDDDWGKGELIEAIIERATT